MIYVIFIIWHFILDWIIKGKWGKAKITELFSHCFVYTSGFIPFFLFFDVNLLWLPVLFVSHLFIDLPDSRNEKHLARFIRWFRKRFSKESKRRILGIDVWYYIWALIVDQLPHLIILLTIIRLRC